MNTEQRSLRAMIYAALFGAGTAAGAFMMIPLPHVPITLQTLFLYVAAGLLGARLGALSQFIYILLGVIGLPVFSGGKAGIGVLAGPTGGYIIGFFIAAFVIGRLVEMKKKAGFIWIVFFLVIGTLIIYLLGTIHLSIVAKFTFTKALLVGVLPFLAGDAVKIIIGGFIIIKLRDKLKPL